MNKQRRYKEGEEKVFNTVIFQHLFISLNLDFIRSDLKLN
jgi:hypothetical protein